MALTKNQLSPKEEYHFQESKKWLKLHMNNEPYLSIKKCKTFIERRSLGRLYFKMWKIRQLSNHNLVEWIATLPKTWIINTVKDRDSDSDYFNLYIFIN